MADLPDYYTQSQLALAEVKYLDGGLDAAKATTPTRKQVYLATDTNKLYFCFTDGEWADITGLYLLLTGGTMSGAIAMGTNKITGLGNPTLAQDAATRAYVLAQAALRLALTGGTMSGDIAMGNNIVSGLKAPTNANDAVRKAYADALEPYTDEEAVAAVEAAGLALAALKKIIYANNGLAQFGVLDGSPTLRGGRVAFPYMVIVQPKDGNTIGEVMVMPKGTETEAWLCTYNADDLDNYGFVDFGIQEALARIVGSKVGTGTAPTALTINLTTRPHANEGYSLGEAGYRWLESWIMHHQLAHPLPVDHTWAGLVAQMTAGIALTIGQACYVGGDSKMELADADAAASMPIMALATGTIVEDAAGQFLLQGFFRDDTWDWTPGGIIYASLTPGALTQDVSGYTTGDQVQVVGIAITADIIYFNPSYELVEIS